MKQYVLMSILLVSMFACPAVLSQEFEPDVVEVHLACSARYRQIASGPQADYNPVNVGQIYALIGNGLKGDHPLGPDVDLRRRRVIVGYDYGRACSIGYYYI